MAKKSSEEQPEGKKIVYYFKGDGSKVISDAPSEDITEETWAQLPKHVQRSIAANRRLYRRGEGDDGSGSEETAAQEKSDRKIVVAVPVEDGAREEPKARKEKSDKAE